MNILPTRNVSVKTRSWGQLATLLGCLAMGAGVVRAADVAASNVSVAELIGSLKSADEKTKIGAIDQLGAEGEQAAPAVAPLTALLKDSSAKVRAHTVRTLGSIGSPAKSIVPALAELLKDPDDNVRRQIVTAIRSINPGPQVTVPLCVKLLEDSDPGVRVRILSRDCRSRQGSGARVDRGAEEREGGLLGVHHLAKHWAFGQRRGSCIGPGAQESAAASPA